MTILRAIYFMLAIPMIVALTIIIFFCEIIGAIADYMFECIFEGFSFGTIDENEIVQ